MMGFPITLLGVGRTMLHIGKLFAWGFNGSGPLALNDTTTRSSPVQVGSSSTWASGSQSCLGTVAGAHVAYINRAGELYVSGANSTGQLGLNDTTARSNLTQVGALTNWSQVSCGGDQMMAVKTDGTLWVCGDNTWGQLGTNNVTSYSSPVQVGALTDWAMVACGAFHAIAIKTDGTLWAWGRNSRGELGKGDTSPRSSPVQVGALTNWAAVAVNGSSLSGTGECSFALKTDGTLWAFGLNSSGQLGLNDVTNRSSPTQLGALTTWQKISSGGATGTSAAIKTDGTLWVWGTNTNGELGQGDTTLRSSPVQVGALTDWAEIAVGSGASGHMVAVKTDGTLWAWGAAADGRLGNSTTTPNKSSPVQIGALTTWFIPFAGYRMSGALQDP